MEVVIWQLFVIGSVVVTYASNGRKIALWVCLAWTAWTIIAVFMLPLVLIQLFFCWGTFGVCNWLASLTSSLRSKDVEVNDLKRHVESILASSDIPDRQVRVLRAAIIDSRASLEIIAGSEHLDRFKRALAEAKTSICILSGWIGSPLLDAEIQRLLCAAVKKGVRIFLGFGWESGSGHEITPTAKSALSFLRRLDRTQVMVAQFANHEKMLVVDNAYFVIGSNNWLSNSTFRNSERSVLLRIPSLASEEARRVEAIVRQHAK